MEVLLSGRAPAQHICMALSSIPSTEKKILTNRKFLHV
jgi:hypothetical protein